MTAPVEVRDQARALREQGKSYREIGEALSVSTSTAHRLTNPEQEARNRDRMRELQRARAAGEAAPARRRKSPAKRAPVVDLFLDDGTPGAFTRGYERALAAGVDPLEVRDACWECKVCGRLPVEGCVCVPVREEKAA